MNGSSLARSMLMQLRHIVGFYRHFWSDRTLAQLRTTRSIAELLMSFGMPDTARLSSCVGNNLADGLHHLDPERTTLTRVVSPFLDAAAPRDGDKRLGITRPVTPP